MALTRSEMLTAIRGATWNGTSALTVRILKGAAPAGSPVATLTLPDNEPVGAAQLATAYRAAATASGMHPGYVALPDGSTVAIGPTAARLGDGAPLAATNTHAGDAEDAPYRALAASRRDRFATRVAIVTGGAQGFGYEFARGLATVGMQIIIADRNTEGAATAARALDELSPEPGVHDAVAVDVSSEESVAAMYETVARRYGGVDLVISNAGVLRAGSVKELSAADFAFVTQVNYTGFFLVSKHAARLLAIQNEAAHTAFPAVPMLTDIIEINSKSGLAGSNKNGAYAGSKFGGIGLVQSFALELVSDNIKVNAICPGNFLDGPLWSDPETGLFTQYLRAGKVPGATTVADVRRAYEAKVPMNRGCTGADVVRAIMYVVEQSYETGQAVPVTGGQEMLR